MEFFIPLLNSLFVFFSFPNKMIFVINGDISLSSSTLQFHLIDDDIKKTRFYHPLPPFNIGACFTKLSYLALKPPMPQEFRDRFIDDMRACRFLIRTFAEETFDNVKEAMCNPRRRLALLCRYLFKGEDNILENEKEKEEEFDETAFREFIERRLQQLHESQNHYFS
jgi:hypothetical protein